MHLKHWLIVSLPLLLASACSSEVMVPSGAEAPTAEPADVRPPPLPKDDVREIHLDLGAGLLECVTTPPKFFFDKTQVRPEDMAAVKELAACLKRPWMKDEKIILIGRADDRGPARYNEQLGLERAKQIKAILVQQGVAADRIGVLSRGEADARGQLPNYSDGYDRRVDIIQLAVVEP